MKQKSQKILAALKVLVLGTKLATAAAIVVTSGFVGAASAGIVNYDAAADFNGTQGGATGVWQYGQSAVPDDPSITPTFVQASFDSGFFKGTNGTWPLVTGDYMHPGDPDTNYAAAVLRFTAPAAGDYTATFSAKLTDFANLAGGNWDYRRDGVRMWLNGTYTDLISFVDPVTWQPAVPGVYPGHEWHTLSLNLAMQAGDIIDFMIDPDGQRSPGWTARTNLYDSTAYTATVQGSVAAVPETSTWVMGFLALGAVLFIVRRNAKASA